VVEGGWDRRQVTTPQIAFAVLSSAGSSWSIAVTFEDPSGIFPSPNSSAPTGFTLLAGGSNQFITVGSSMLPIAGYQFTLNAPGSAGRQGHLHRDAGRIG
jgi:hypothetical protein